MEPPDLSAHEILLDLAKGPSGEVKLVTTNFDLLFEAASPSLRVSAPASLPDPRRENTFNGIIHLHGRGRAKAEELLSLVGDARRDALVMLSFHLPWISHRNTPWADRKIVSVLDASNSEDRQAFWAGIFWSGRLPDDHGLFHRIKPYLLALVRDYRERRANGETIALFLLLGWGTRTGPDLAALISDNEMRQALLESDGEFRAQVLWRLSRLPTVPPGTPPVDSLDFLRNVWPRQLLARSPDITERLVDFAFNIATSRERFEPAVETILPLLTLLSPDSWILHEFQHREEHGNGRFSPDFSHKIGASGPRI